MLERLARSRGGWIGLALLGLASRLAVACRDLDALDRLFIPDDTYYLLGIARSLARGLGPTADGVTLTSGFQPLLVFLQTPLFWLLDGTDPPLRATLLGLGVLDVAVALLLGRIVVRVAGPVSGWLSAAAWLTLPQAMRLAMGGLETTLALLMTLAVVELWSRYRERDGARPALGLGVAIGLALLARVDTVFLVGLLGLYELVLGDRRRLAGVVATSALVVAPWWIYCALVFGSVVPESGPAARELALLYQGPQVHWTALRWSGLMGLFPIDLDLLELRGRVWIPAGAALLGSWLLWSLYALLGARLLGRLPAVSRVPVVTLFLHAGIQAVFYVAYVPVVWFFVRYLCVTQVCLCILFGIGAVHLTRSPVLRRSVWALASIWLVVAGARTAAFLFLTADLPPRWTVEGASGYRVPAREALATLPEGAVVGALQTGALGYFAPEGVQVVNLDGVVDGRAAAALASYRLLSYARERGVEYFCDWPLQHHMFQERAGAPVRFRQLWRARRSQQSGHVLTLSAVLPPDEGAGGSPSGGAPARAGSS